MKAIQVRNPRTGQYDYSFIPASSEEIENICEKLRKAQPNWDSIGLEKRLEVLKQWKSELLKRKDELIEKIIIDSGRYKESVGEFEGIIKLIDKLSNLAPEIMATNDQNDTTIPFIKAGSDLTPYQLVGNISPWNFPFSTSLNDAIPALIAGSAVIVKPSEVTPRFVETVVETIEKVPQLKEVLAFVNGAGETGAKIVEQVDIICFTGSVATGRKIAVAAAERFIPSILELGGKDPAIVTQSTDINRAVPAILFGSLRNAGQVCVSVERIYVAESIYEEFTNQLVEKAKKLTINYPNVKQGDIGPLIFEKQAEIISEQLKDAVEKGANIRSGGQIEELDGGLWCYPTVVTEVNHSMKIMKEETFGPILPVMSFKNVEEAIRLANDTEYGLTGSVFAGTDEEAIEVAKKVNSGGININDCGLSSFLIGEGEERQPFNYSGMGGSRSGKSAILRFMRKKALYTNTTTDRSPWWYNV